MQPTLSQLLSAIEDDRPSSVRTLLKRDPDLGRAHDTTLQKGRTALMWAAVLGRGACLQELLAYSDANAQSRHDGSTALMLAAEVGAFHIIEVLLPLTDAKALSTKGDTALMRAASRGSLPCLLALLPHSDATHMSSTGANALINASAANHEACVEALIPHCDPNAIGVYGEETYTAMSMAISFGAERAFHALLEVTDLQFKHPKTGKNLLMMAFSRNSSVIVQALLPRFDMNARDTWGRTPLMLAATEGRRKHVVSLLSAIDPNHRSDPLAADKKGNTALICAVISQTPDVVAALLPESRLFHRNKKGHDALQLALDNILNAQGQPRLTMIDIVHQFVPFLPLDRLQEIQGQKRRLFTTSQRALVTARIERLELEEALAPASQGLPPQGTQGETMRLDTPNLETASTKPATKTPGRRL